MSTTSPALTAYKRIKEAAVSRRGGVRLSFEECAAIYWGDQAVKDAIDNVLLEEDEKGGASTIDEPNTG